MRIDEFGMIVLEQNPEGDPGNLGDSWRETFADIHLDFMLGKTDIDRSAKVYGAASTAIGYLRHPHVPQDWREKDFSGDQWKMGYICLACVGPQGAADEMRLRLKNNGYRYGNGDFAHPTIFTVISRGQSSRSAFKDLAILAQITALNLAPIRWNDERKWFESTSDASADWLNYLHMLFQCEYKGHTWASRLAKKLTNPRTAIAKVEAYYAKEPNCGWLLDKYRKVIVNVWSES